MASAKSAAAGASNMDSAGGPCAAWKNKNVKDELLMKRASAGAFAGKGQNPWHVNSVKGTVHAALKKRFSSSGFVTDAAEPYKVSPVSDWCKTMSAAKPGISETSSPDRMSSRCSRSGPYGASLRSIWRASENLTHISFTVNSRSAGARAVNACSSALNC